MLTDLLYKFIGQFSAGYAFILPYAESILYYMVSFEVVLLGLFWALGVGNIMVDAIRKILLIGFFTFIIFNFPTIHHAIMSSMIQVGLSAGGDGVSAHGFTDPSRYFDYGIQNASKMLDNVKWFQLLNGPGIVLALAALFIVIGFGILSFQIISTLLEFYLLSVLGVFLLPFGVFRHLAFIGEKTFGMIVGFAIKLLVLAFIVAVIDPVLSSTDILQMEKYSEVSYRSAFQAMGVSFFIGWLSWSIPSMAASLLTGGPSLTAGAAAQTAMAAGLGVGAGVMASMAAVRAGGGALVGATRIASGAGSAAALASATNAMGGGGRLSQIGAGLKGAVKYGGQTAASAVEGISERFKTAVNKGRVEGYKNTGGTATPSMQRQLQQDSGSNRPPQWAQRALNAGRIARYAIPGESQPHGASHAPITSK